MSRGGYKTYDQWKTEPEECSYCGAMGHLRRDCPKWKEEKALAEEQKAEWEMEDRMIERKYGKRD